MYIPSELLLTKITGAFSSASSVLKMAFPDASVHVGVIVPTTLRVPMPRTGACLSSNKTCKNSLFHDEYDYFSFFGPRNYLIIYLLPT